MNSPDSITHNNALLKLKFYYFLFNQYKSCNIAQYIIAKTKNNSKNAHAVKLKNEWWIKMAEKCQLVLKGSEKNEKR